MVTGVKQGWVFARRLLISGEIVFVNLELGQLLMMSRDLNDMSQVIAVMILIIASGYIVEGLAFQTPDQRLQRTRGVEEAVV